MVSGLGMTVFLPFSIGYFLPFISWIHPNDLNNLKVICDVAELVS